MVVLDLPREGRGRQRTERTIFAESPAGARPYPVRRTHADDAQCATTCGPAGGTDKVVGKWMAYRLIWARAGFGTLCLVLPLVACGVTPKPLSDDETETRIDTDLSAMFSNQERVEKPISLHMAMARALSYNLDNRLKVMEEALANKQLDVAKWDMLPDLIVSAGVDRRSNTDASSSRSVETQTESLELSTSVEKTIRTSQLRFSWNVLDFGVSYFAAKQNADRVLVALERRRKVVHNIVQDVRDTFWRAVAAERLMKRLDPMIARVRRALEEARAVEARRLRAPLESLTYQATLLDTIRELQNVKRQLVGAKTELAGIMNLPLDRDFKIAVPAEDSATLPTLDLDLRTLERMALSYRPELREEDYQTRISADEVRKAMLRLLPGLELEWAYNYNSNDFLLNDNWASSAAQVTWNLFNVLRGPDDIEAAEARVDVVAARRMALSMAVLTQLYVAMSDFAQARENLRIRAELADVNHRILEQLRANLSITGELPIIRGEVDALLADLRRDFAYAEAQNALGRVFVSVGADPLPEQVAAIDLTTLESTLRKTEEGWFHGRFFLQRFGAVDPFADLVADKPGAEQETGGPAAVPFAPEGSLVAGRVGADAQAGITNLLTEGGDSAANAEGSCTFAALLAVFGATCPQSDDG